MKKFLLTVFLSIALIITVTATVSAEYAFELNPSEITDIEPGQVISVDITVDNIKVQGGIETVDFVLTYSDTLTYSSVKSTLPTGWKMWDAVSNKNNRTVKIAAVDDGNTANPAVNDGDITFTVNFVVADDIAGGDSITIEFSRVIGTDAVTYDPVDGIGNKLDYCHFVNQPELLTITKLPLKTSFMAGRTFNSVGMEVAVTYTNGTVVPVTDFTVDTPDIMTEGVKDVVVRWGELTTTYQITVEPPMLTGITVTPPTKLSYYVGDTLDKNGMLVIAKYENNTTVDVTSKATLTPSKFTAVGTTTVTVNYSTKSATFTVTVNEAVQEDIAGGTVGDIIWNVTKDNVLVFSGNGAIPDYQKASSIPWKSTKINDVALQKTITSIVVEEGITGIGDYAFYGLGKVTSIEISGTVKYIGTRFMDSTAVTELVIPSGLVTIRNSAFTNTNSNLVVTLPESVRDIQGSILYGTQTLKIKAPEKSYVAEYTGFYALMYPTGKGSITFESDGTTAAVPVIRFGSGGDEICYAIYQDPIKPTNAVFEYSGIGPMRKYTNFEPKFEGRPGVIFSPLANDAEKVERNIAVLRVREGITTIGNNAFFMATKATTLYLHDGITKIGMGAFKNAQRLSVIRVPEKTTVIEMHAFQQCNYLTDLYIPDAVEKIDMPIFTKMDNPADVTVHTNNTDIAKVISEAYPDVKIVPYN